MDTQEIDAAVVVSGLSKHFGSRTVVEDLSFTVHPGVVTGLLGPNGAGRTTTLRMLLSLVSQSAGTATISGRAYRDLERPGRTVGVQLDAAGFHPGRTGRDHLRTYAPAAGVDDARVDEVLARVGLAHDARRRVRTYSLGMRQRLGIAAALLPDAPVLICDEPSNGLDPDGMRWLRGLLRTEAARGRTVLVSSHLLSEMDHTVDSVVILDQGRLAYAGDVTDAANVVVRVRTSDNEALAAALAISAPEAEVVAGAAGTLVVSGSSPEAVGRIAAHSALSVLQLGSERRGLEELFFAVTGRAAEAGCPDSVSAG